MPRTVLLADDSVTIQKVVGLSFASEDIELVSVDNGEDAVARAREIRPDLVLADVVMPGKTGYEVCEALRDDPATAGVPVLLLTGIFESFDEARAADVGACGHITKPFEAQTLVDRVREILARAPVGGPPDPVDPGPAETAATEVLPPEPELSEPEPEPFAPEPAEEIGAEPAFDTPQPVETDPLSATGGSTEPTRAAPDALPPAEPPAAGDPLGLGDDDPSMAFDDFADADDALDLADDAGSDPLFEGPLDEPESDVAGAEDLDEVFGPAGSHGSDEPLEEIEPEAVSAASVSASNPEIDLGNTRSAVELGDEDLLEDAAEDTHYEFGPDEADGASQSGIEARVDVFAEEESPAPAAVLDPDPEDVYAVGDVGETTDPIAAAEPAPAESDSGFYRDLDPAPPTGPSVPSVETAPAAGVVPDLTPMLRERLHETLEKVAWEAFSDLSEQVARQALERVEAIAWEVIPQMAEAIVREEIRRLQGEGEE